MLCPVCHTQNRDNAKFCKGCGLLFSADSANTVQETAEDSPPESSQEAATQVASSADSSENNTADGQSAQAPVATPVDAETDISLAPTQILTPQQMLEIQSRRWQHELDRERGSAVAESDAGSTPDVSDLPTIAVPLPDAEQPAPSSQIDIADQPTTIIRPQAPAQTPPPPPQEALDAQNGPPPTPAYIEEAIHPSIASANQATSETEETGDATEPPQTEEQAPQEQKEEQVEQEQTSTPEQSQQPVAASTADEQQEGSDSFPVLATGTLVNDRYEVSEVISSDANEHVYEVTDHKGYLRCWNCGSEENAEGDEFCINCGAGLLNASYLMHEYPATASGKEENVVASTIINTFVDQGHTYLIEQPQATQSAFPTGVHLLAATDSDGGNVRRSEPNEDSTLVVQFERIHESISSPAGVFIVADGLGGHENGQVASHMTINIIAERILRELIVQPLVTEKNNEETKAIDEDSLVGLLRGAVEDANTVLCQKNQRDNTDMGSTITGFMIVGDYAYILNVGDSRTYLFRDENLYQLTTDHSLVGQLVAGGLIDPDDVYTHPQRSQIYRSLGDKLNVQVDVIKQQIHPNDVLLSCSDGLWEMVRNPQIKDILSTTQDPQAACTSLLEAANTNGGEDNVSAVVVYVR